ncbi:glycosyltransferase family 2 protein [Brachybacterium sp. Marseille-Q2903]|uniref:Glycosyltransferase family 2 protein n=2 Tax=Dermabacteraceae TaxID=85020 RepID=A0ABR9W0S4_9MICO|nr:glycosyltransferase family A protein [Brachybacterium epidermidis]MBE9402928.1 glycosyltransferase family 2 protein [Brachybacterium epidermidis]
MNPQVTVVMPVFNGARTVRQSIVSVLDQTCSDLELLVVDDSSTDHTTQIVESLVARDSRVRLIRRDSGGGPAAARNTGIAQARGRYLAFCDADDLWLPTKLDRQLELARSTDAPLIYCGYHRIAADYAGSAAQFVPEGRVVHVPTALTRAGLRRRNVIGNLTAVLDLRRTGPVSMPDVPGAEDWALWLCILAGGATAAGIDEPLALYRAAQPESHSSDRPRALLAVWRVLRQQEQLSVPVAAFHLVTASVAALCKNRI